MIQEQYSRISHHTLTSTGYTGTTIFTIPPSEDFTDDSWSATDLALSEIGVAEGVGRAFIRIGNQVKEFNFSTGATAQNLNSVLTVGNTTGGQNIEMTSGDIIEGQNNGVINLDLGNRIVIARTTSYTAPSIDISTSGVSITTVAEYQFEFNTYAFKTIDIGTWDIAAGGTINVAHNLSATEWKTIINLNGFFRNDADTTYGNLGQNLGTTVNLPATGVSPPYIASWNSTNIVLNAGTLLTGDADYDGTTFSRGLLRFQYKPD